MLFQIIRGLILQTLLWNWTLTRYTEKGARRSTQLKGLVTRRSILSCLLWFIIVRIILWSKVFSQFLLTQCFPRCFDHESNIIFKECLGGEEKEIWFDWPLMIKKEEPCIDITKKMEIPSRKLDWWMVMKPTLEKKLLYEDGA